VAHFSCDRITKKWLKSRLSKTAVFAILNSMAHEIIHYQQWIEDRDFDEDEAENKSTILVEKYYEWT